MNNTSNNRELIISCRDNRIEGFKKAVVFLNNINEELNWTGRRVGISGLHEIKRTPLMLAATYGSLEVLRHILSIPGIEINKASSTDNLTALDCAFLYRHNPEILNTLRSRDAKYYQQDDPGLSRFHSSNASRMDYGIIHNCPARGVWVSDELGWHNQTEYFMMFLYKIKHCNKNYNHPPQNCPYLHLNEDISTRRRAVCNVDGNFTCPDWPDHCPRGLACLLAHGDYEKRFHPSEFRTRWCWHGMLCSRKVCSFAHHEFELREKFQMVDSPNAVYAYGSTELQNAAAIQWQYDVPVPLWRPDFSYHGQSFYGRGLQNQHGIVVELWPPYYSNHGRSFYGRGLLNQHGGPTNSVAELWPPDFSNHGRSFYGRGLLNQHGWAPNSVSSSTSMPFRPQSTVEQSYQIVGSWNAEGHGPMGHIVQGIENLMDESRQ